MKHSSITLLIAISTLMSAAHAEDSKEPNPGNLGGGCSAGNTAACVYQFNKNFNDRWDQVYQEQLKPTKANLGNESYLKKLENTNTTITNLTKDEKAETSDNTSNNGKTTPTSSFSLPSHISTITLNNISNSLTRFLYEFNQNPLATADQKQQIKGSIEAHTENSTNGKISYEQYTKDNSPLGLIVGINESPLPSTKSTKYQNPMSDYLYQAAKKTGKVSDKILRNNDKTINFSNLFEPISYSTTTNSNFDPQNYLVYAAESRKNLIDGLDFSDVRSDDNYKKLLQGDAKGKSPNSNPFLDLIMTVRTTLAIRSIAIDTLQYLIMERTPSLPSPDPQDKKLKSPLQLEEYQADHRISDPNWYKGIMKDDAVTLQRTIAIELAEIEHQNYQAHLDRERILAAITATNLQSNTGSSIALKEKIAKANAFIQTFKPSATSSGGNN